MSKTWYYECRDHTPPIRSDMEVTQHTGDAAFRAAEALVARRPVAHPDDDDRAAEPAPSEYFDRNQRTFLWAHPRCRVTLVSEYDERLDVEQGPVGPAPPHRSAPLPNPAHVDRIRPLVQRLRWRVIYLLDRSPRFCWADLVGFAQQYGEPTRLRDLLRSGESCRAESEANRHRTCYCGKFQSGCLRSERADL